MGHFIARIPTWRSPLAVAAGAVVTVALLCAHAATSAQRRPAGMPPASRAARPTGEQIFKQRCASCHGVNGEGTRHYPKALTGTRSVNELARFIAQSMPPGPAQQRLPAADAQRVAAYIYQAFYSPVAQARRRPPRIELVRLTVGQYRNALADLIGSFRPPARWDERRGLQGEYFSSRDFRPQQRVLQRIDPEIRFEFGQATPTPEQTDPYQYAMRWTGSVIVPETGEYEFILRTEHSVRLWINDPARPLIDAWVRSANETEVRESIFLLGGRAYPLRLEFSKSTQGVNDQMRLRSRPPAPATLALQWRRPRRPPEVIPQRHLIPTSVPETYVVATPFPPDDRSEGYERGTAISREWDRATTEAALDAAGYVAARLDALAGTNESAPDRTDRLRDFFRRFVTRAFRRPLTPELEEFFIERHLREAPDLETAAKRVVLLTLKSPRFLYRELGEGDAYDVAERLSFALWDSIPDEELLRAAAAGELATREQVARQAERMVADPRARAKLRDFFLRWLHVEQYPDVAKNPSRFPGFDDHVLADLATSLELFLEEILASERADFRALLLSEKVYLNGRLAALYGVSLPPDAGFQPVALDPGQRAGVLTHPYLLTVFAYLDTSSPIHRGVLIARNLLGRVLLPPPEAFTPLPAELHPHLTTRERVALQTRSAACMSCHGMINPLGFTLERFDAIGRLRDTENGKPIDSSGSYLARNGQQVRFAGARDLARYIAESDDGQTAFVERLFQHAIQQPVQAYGPRALADLRRAFVANEFNIRRQLVETAVLAALRGQR